MTPTERVKAIYAEGTPEGVADFFLRMGLTQGGRVTTLPPPPTDLVDADESGRPPARDLFDSEESALTRLKNTGNNLVDQWLKENPSGAVREFLVERLGLKLPSNLGFQYQKLYNKTHRKLAKGRHRLKLPPHRTL